MKHKRPECDNLGPNQQETRSEEAAELVQSSRPAAWTKKLETMVLLAALASASAPVKPTSAQQASDFFHPNLIKSAQQDDEQQQRPHHLQLGGQQAVRHQNSLALLAHLLQSAEQRRRPTESFHQNQRSSSFWTTGDLLPAASNHEAESAGLPFGPDGQRPLQFVSYRAASPTTPTLSRQLAAPPPFYELGLAPTNALQLEPAEAPSQRQSVGRQQRNEASSEQPNVTTARSAAEAAAKPELPRSNEQPSDQKPPESGESEQLSVAPAEKGVEPRQRRRIFNRILKKAEWNHLFVELSKVFLRYFLDLALKDIIGKQSGSSGTDSTTSRKKLDAQSELADLLKDFVKAAISASI